MSHNANAVRAKVSVNKMGGVYIGVKARRALGLGYNDRIHVNFEEFDVSVTEYLNSAGRVHDASAKRVWAAFEESGSVHATAIIEPSPLTWDDEHDFEERYDNSATLDMKPIR